MSQERIFVEDDLVRRSVCGENRIPTRESLARGELSSSVEVHPQGRSRASHVREEMKMNRSTFRHPSRLSFE